ncbi:hypothetical protein C0J52_23855 [Blattella germanica]|nr:hypothetical protein C0J52_23855 [Blattella germanica]
MAPNQDGDNGQEHVRQKKTTESDTSNKVNKVNKANGNGSIPKQNALTKGNRSNREERSNRMASSSKQNTSKTDIPDISTINENGNVHNTTFETQEYNNGRRGRIALPNTCQHSNNVQRSNFEPSNRSRNRRRGLPQSMSWNQVYSYTPQYTTNMQQQVMQPSMPPYYDPSIFTNQYTGLNQIVMDRGNWMENNVLRAPVPYMPSSHIQQQPTYAYTGGTNFPAHNVPAVQPTTFVPVLGNFEQMQFPNASTQNLQQSTYSCSRENCFFSLYGHNVQPTNNAAAPILNNEQMQLPNLSTQSQQQSTYSSTEGCYLSAPNCEQNTVSTNNTAAPVNNSEQTQLPNISTQSQPQSTYSCTIGNCPSTFQNGIPLQQTNGAGFEVPSNVEQTQLSNIDNESRTCLPSKENNQSTISHDILKNSTLNPETEPFVYPCIDSVTNLVPVQYETADHSASIQVQSYLTNSDSRKNSVMENSQSSQIEIAYDIPIQNVSPNPEIFEVDSFPNQETFYNTEYSRSVIELKDDLRNALVCVICLNCLLPTIYICKGGHIACTYCFSAFKICYLCDSYFETNSITLDVVFGCFKFCCRNNIRGCNESLPANEIMQHDNICLYEVCPFAEEMLCNWTGNYSQLEAHIIEEHKTLVEETEDRFIIEDYNLPSIVEKSKIYKTNNWESQTIILHAFGQYFIYNKNKLYYEPLNDFVKEIRSTFIWHVGPRDKTANYCAYIKFLGRDNLLTGKPVNIVNVRIPAEAILRSKIGINLTKGDYSRCVKSDLTIEVEIRKNRPCT